MIVVNGLNGSGFEAVLNSMPSVLGDKHNIGTAYRNRESVKEHGPGEIPAYEKYIDKFSPADPAAVIKDIADKLPDGVWPPYNIQVESVRPVMGGVIRTDAAVRMGGSLLNMELGEISRIYLVLASPAMIRFRRGMLRQNLRALDMKYANDRMYPAALSGELQGWGMSEDNLMQEYTVFKDYVNNCLAKFGDKVVFIDGETRALSFEHEGVQRVVMNCNYAETPMDGGGFDIRKEIGHDLGLVYVVWDELKQLAAARNATPAVPMKYGAPTLWFCARTHKLIGVVVCRNCRATSGDYVMQDARPGWDKEPCAFEVAYGPEPHKTIEQSIANHSWNALP